MVFVVATGEVCAVACAAAIVADMAAAAAAAENSMTVSTLPTPALTRQAVP